MDDILQYAYQFRRGLLYCLIVDSDKDVSVASIAPGGSSLC